MVQMFKLNLVTLTSPVQRCLTSFSVIHCFTAKSIAMTADHRKRLQSNTVTIVKNLVFSEEFVSVLMRDGILTPEEKERIEVYLSLCFYICLFLA